MNAGSSTGSSTSVTLKKDVQILEREKGSNALLPMVGNMRFKSGTQITYGPVETMTQYDDPIDAVPIQSPRIATGIYVLMSELEAATK